MAKAKYTKDSQGYFQTKVWDGTYTDSGKKHRVVLRSSKSSKDLEQKVIEHNRKIEERKFVRETNVPFNKYAATWVKEYKGHLEVNTQKMYSNIVEKHFKALTVPVGEISRGMYITALGSVEGTRTRQQFQLVFKQVIKSAIKDKLLPPSIYDDIFSDTIKVKYKPKDKRALTLAEKEAISKCSFKNDRDLMFLELLLYTGMRGEEIRALTVFDVDFKKKEISVTKAVVFDGNNPIEKDTKNGIHRTIPIDSIVTHLKAYISDLSGTKLFSMPDGNYLTKSAYRKMWDRVLQEIQRNCNEPINGLTPHIFRHNYCASLCNQIPNISIQRIAMLLGDSEKMVIEVYNHEVAGKDDYREVLANALSLQKNEEKSETKVRHLAE